MFKKVEKFYHSWELHVSVHIEGGTQKNPKMYKFYKFIYKKLCIYSYMFKL